MWAVGGSKRLSTAGTQPFPGKIKLAGATERRVFHRPGCPPVVSPAPSLSRQAPVRPALFSPTLDTQSTPLLGSPPLSCLGHLPRPGLSQPPSASLHHAAPTRTVRLSISSTQPFARGGLASRYGRLKVLGSMVSLGGHDRQCPLAGPLPPPIGDLRGV